MQVNVIVMIEKEIVSFILIVKVMLQQIIEILKGIVRYIEIEIGIVVLLIMIGIDLIENVDFEMIEFSYIEIKKIIFYLEEGVLIGYFMIGSLIDQFMKDYLCLEENEGFILRSECFCQFFY